MKQILQQIGSFLMALLVLFSTLSFSVEQHFCGEMLVDTAIFGEAKSCGMEMHADGDDSDAMDNMCCSEKQITFEGQDELKVNLVKLSFEQQVFIVSLVSAFFSFEDGEPDEFIPLDDYPPPLVDRDIRVLYQTFLI